MPQALLTAPYLLTAIHIIFLMLLITKYHKVESIKMTELYSFTVLEPRHPK